MVRNKRLSSFGSQFSSEQRPEHYYPREGQFHIVALRLQNIRQLFYSLDASPFLEHDLDEKAETHIVRSMTELRSKPSVKLVFYLPHDQLEEAKTTIPRTVFNYFEYSEDMAKYRMSQHFAEARNALFIGLVFLTLCVAGTFFLAEFSSSQLSSVGKWVVGLRLSIAQESLLIIGWVAMWRPIEMFLYDWWPLLRHRDICRKIKQAPVEIRPWA